MKRTKSHSYLPRPDGDGAARPSLDEIIKIHEQVGDTPKKTVRWLLQFAQEDLAALPAASRRAVLYAVTYFVLPMHGVRSSGWRKKLLPGEWPDEYLPSLKDVRVLQGWLRDAIQCLLTKKVLLVKFGAVTGCHFWGGPVGKQTWNCLLHADRPENAFRIRAFELLRSFPDRIQACRECGAWFITKRKDQVFHARKCQLKDGMRRFKAKQPGFIPGRKRGRPRKENRPAGRKSK